MFMALLRNGESIDPHHLPHVWRATALASLGMDALPTGYPALDAQLPGGGWPAAGLVELLQSPVRGFLEACPQHDFDLLRPVLARLMAQGRGPVVLVGSPQPSGTRCALSPFTPGLAARGLPPECWLWVQADTPAQHVWACEQVLRCAEVVAVLAWLPQPASEALRRLHRGALETGKPLFVFRPATVSAVASAAPLRLQLDGVDALRVRVLKRRGPPLEQPVQLEPHSERLAEALAARRKPAGMLSVPAVPVIPGARRIAEKAGHALDCSI
jgi:protein ImuA